MIILDTTTRKIQVKMDGKNTTDSDVVASWDDVTATTYTPASAQFITNSTTAVDVIAAPAASTQRRMKYLSVVNKDSVSRIVTVIFNDNGTSQEILETTLAIGDTVTYANGAWWQTYKLGSVLLLTKGGTNSTTATNNQVVFCYNGKISTAGPMTDGQLMFGATGALPGFYSASGDISQITALGAFTIANLAISTGKLADLAVTNAKIAAGTIDLAAKVSGILPIANGGRNDGTALGGGRPVISNATGIVESNGYSQKSADYSVVLADCDSIIDCDASAGNVTITLPSAASTNVGFCVTIRRNDQSNEAFAVKIQTSGTDGIDGVLATNGNAVNWLRANNTDTQFACVTFRSTGVAGATKGKGWAVQNANDFVSSTVGSTLFDVGSAHYKAITNITLTPGEWDISAIAVESSGGGTTIFNAGISTTSTDDSGGMVFGTNASSLSNLGNSGDSGITIPAWRTLVTTATKLFYLKVQASWSVTQPSHYGRISARRTR